MEIIRKNKILLGLVVFVLLVQSLGSILRWDLNEQIGMAENLFYNNNLYPNLGSNMIFSIYTPGVSIIAFILKKLSISEYLIETLLTLSSVILFFTVVLFYKIIKLYQKANIRFFDIQIIYLLVFCSEYFRYATEFKPDTLAFLFCFYGLYRYEKKKDIGNFLFGAILISISIIFKQQSLFFVLGLILFSIFNLKKTHFLYFTLTSSILYLATTVLLYKNEGVFMYNFKVISDDGFQGFIDILKFSWDQLKSILFFLCIIIPITLKTDLKKQEIFQKINNPYFFTGITILVGSTLSLIKNGGNLGSFQVGFFYCSIFVWLLFEKIKFSKWVRPICIMVLIISIDLGKIVNYYNYHYLKKHLIELKEENKSLKILTDSESYSLSRHLLNFNSSLTSITSLELINPSIDLKKHDINSYDIIILQTKEVTRLPILNNELFRLYKKSNLSSVYVKE